MIPVSTNILCAAASSTVVTAYDSDAQNIAIAAAPIRFTASAAALGIPTECLTDAACAAVDALTSAFEDVNVLVVIDTVGAAPAKGVAVMADGYGNSDVAAVVVRVATEAIVKMLAEYAAIEAA